MAEITKNYSNFKFVNEVGDNVTVYFKDKDSVKSINNSVNANRITTYYESSNGKLIKDSGVSLVSDSTIGTTFSTYSGADATDVLNYKGILNLLGTDSFFVIAGSGGTTQVTLTVPDTYTLADACAKGVDTSITTGSTSTNLPTTAAVATYVDNNTPKDINTVVTKVKTTPFSTQTELKGSPLNLFTIDDTTKSLVFNTLSVFTDANKCTDIASSTFYPKTWSGLTSFSGNDVWTDGNNIYYSSGSKQYVLDKSTSTWSSKSWTGLTNFYGSKIWTDGNNIYYSTAVTQYVLNKSTSTWSTKTWTGLTSLNGSSVWTDGDNIYYSYGASQYVLDKSTSTWTSKSWTGLTNLDGSYVWTDGVNYYYSYLSNQYVLDKSTSTWTAKSWSGLTSFSSDNVWTDGENIYYSSESTQKVLDKSTSTWTDKTWSGYTSFDGNYIWTDSTNYYFSYVSDQYTIIP